MHRTAPDALDQAPDQRHVTLLADLTAQPQARLDHHGQRHPHDATLFLDADLISLHLSQVPWSFDQSFLHRLPLATGACPPISHSALVKPPSAATIACTGHPWASKVTTSTTVSAEVRRR